MASQSAPRWIQKAITLREVPRGCHLVTREVLSAVQEELSSMKIGMANIFLQHTSASLSINENADPAVRTDMEEYLNQAVNPKTLDFSHTDEGDDDMPGHVKSSLFGVSLNIPISNGKLALGTWQGIWLCEHRDRGGPRKIVVTLNGV